MAWRDIPPLMEATIAKPSIERDAVIISGTLSYFGRVAISGTSRHNGYPDATSRIRSATMTPRSCTVSSSAGYENDDTGDYGLGLSVVAERRDLLASASPAVPLEAAMGESGTLCQP